MSKMNIIYVRQFIFIISLIFLQFMVAFSQDSISVWIPDTCGCGDMLIPVMVSDLTDKGVNRVDITLTVEGDVLQLKGTSRVGTLTEQWGVLVCCPCGPTTISLVTGGNEPLSGSGKLINIKFRVIGSSDDTATIHFSEFKFNDGQIPVVTKDGLFRSTCGLSVPDIWEKNASDVVTILVPNPFCIGMLIGYTLLTTSEIHLLIYNASGKLVRNLFDGKQAPGYYKIHWNGNDNFNNKVPSGIYFCRIQVHTVFGAGNYTKTKKMILLK